MARRRNKSKSDDYLEDVSYSDDECKGRKINESFWSNKPEDEY